MDDFARQFRRPLKPHAIAAFAVGTVAAYILQFSLGLGGGRIFTTLIVAAVGGLWYKVLDVV